MKLSVGTIVLLAGLAIPPLGAWIEMRVAVARLQDSVADIDHRLARIERSVYPVAINDQETP